jgi:uncharacterized protein (DUF2252 family)
MKRGVGSLASAMSGIPADPVRQLRDLTRRRVLTQDATRERNRVQKLLTGRPLAEEQRVLQFASGATKTRFASIDYGENA